VCAGWISAARSANPARGGRRSAHDLVVELPEIFLRSALRREGFGDDEVRRMRRAGRLTPVRRGSYVLGAPPEDRDARHALRVQAELAHLADGAVVSHASAAVLHGLPTWGMRLDRVHVTRARRSGGRAGRQVHVHTAPLDPDEVETVGGIPVTSVARTVTDLARTIPFEPAVAVADAALHALINEPEHLAALQAALVAAVARSAGWRGCPDARRVLAFADARSGSVGESRSRVAIHRAGLPTPVLQWEVIGSAGQWIGFVDFGWPKQRTVGEFDGKEKYGRLLKPGQSPADAVYLEKRREDALRAETLSVVRWGWDALSDFASTAARLWACLRA
jgi:hypothetical protein